MIPAAYAQVTFSDPKINPVAKVGTIASLVNVIGPILMAVGGLICLAMLLTGGFKYITSSGEPEQIQQAKRTITFAIIGLVLLISATLFVNLLAYFLGVKSFFSK